MSVYVVQTIRVASEMNCRLAGIGGRYKSKQLCMQQKEMESNVGAVQDEGKVKH